MVTRDDIRRAVHGALEPLPGAIALWEGGSTAFGRDDDLSDVDMQIAVEEDAVEAVFLAVEDALPPRSFAMRIPEPTWHGHSQKFYRFENAPPETMLDLVVMKRDTDRRYSERERHGEPRVYFDKDNWLQVTSVDPDAQRETIRARLAELRGMFELTSVLVPKAIARGDAVEALAFYQTRTWRPLVEVLRMRHAPARFDFGPRYLDVDLPADVAARLQKLAYVADLDDLRTKNEAAVHWFAETADAWTAENGG